MRSGTRLERSKPAAWRRVYVAIVSGRTSRSTLALADVKRAVVEVEFSRAAEAPADGSDDDVDDLEAFADDTDELDTDEEG